MKRIIKIGLTILLLFLFYQVDAKSQSIQLSENSKISLITNDPSNLAIYTLFGHTAIRVKDTANQLDIVFNYGLFDFSSENFVYRFAKGKTDYSVGYTLFNNYLSGYKHFNINITEQILNLTLSEKQNILNALITNSLPKNKVYRYNYFYDNCSTRPRNIIEENIFGRIQYLYDQPKQSYRMLIHECLTKHPWVRFGIDLVIGVDADKTITIREKHFLPQYLKHSFENATIKNANGSEKKLVIAQKKILHKEKSDTTSRTNLINQPFFVGIILLLITIILSSFFYKNKLTTLNKIFDITLFSIAGIAGCIIFFLMYFSTHPCTNPNWNLVWLNPLELVFAILFSLKYFTKSVQYYHFINFAVLTIFVIIFPLACFLQMPQHMEIAFLPYILTLLLRSGTNVLMYKHKNRN